ncbi:hypothetical protein OIU78_006275 [Salix suchowensis]|nr:hypothetical protein OIU78_006275 [Salix suchowensis]
MVGKHIKCLKIVLYIRRDYMSILFSVLGKSFSYSIVNFRNYNRN